MKTIGMFIFVMLALACSEPRPSGPPPSVTPDGQGGSVPLPSQDAVRCDKLMAEMRALRDGPQPCDKADDCWVFHNGEEWDGCPVEVNKANNAVLERMRAEIDGLGCPVSKGASCAAQEVKFCVGGNCGGGLLLVPGPTQ